MTEVLDYAYGRPNPLAVKSSGFAGVVRYVVPGNTKSVDANEYASLRAGGCTVTLVYEGSAGQILNGAQQGASDAQQALRQAHNVGASGRVIYFACDVDATSAGQFAAIDAYLRAAGQTIGANRVGVYGGEKVIAHVQASGTARWFWQTAAWSESVRPGIHLYQRIGYVTVGGVQCDVNEVYRVDYGQEPSPNITPPQPDQPEEDDMTPEQAKQLADVHKWLPELLHATAMDAKPAATDKLHQPTPPYSLWAVAQVINRNVKALAAHVGAAHLVEEVPGPDEDVAVDDSAAEVPGP